MQFFFALWEKCKIHFQYAKNRRGTFHARDEVISFNFCYFLSKKWITAGVTAPPIPTNIPANSHSLPFSLSPFSRLKTFHSFLRVAFFRNFVQFSCAYVLLCVCVCLFCHFHFDYRSRVHLFQHCDMYGCLCTFDSAKLIYRFYCYSLFFTSSWIHSVIRLYAPFLECITFIFNLLRLRFDFGFWLKLYSVWLCSGIAAHRMDYFSLFWRCHCRQRSLLLPFNARYVVASLFIRRSLVLIGSALFRSRKISWSDPISS